jgi:hypothetical protein
LTSEEVPAILKGEICENIRVLCFPLAPGTPQLTYMVMCNLSELKTMFTSSFCHKPLLHNHSAYTVMNSCLDLTFHNLKKRNESHSHTTHSSFPSAPQWCLSSKHLSCCKTNHLSQNLPALLLHWPCNIQWTVHSTNKMTSLSFHCEIKGIHTHTG